MLVDEVRSACARVAGRAEHVRIVEAAIEHYARTLPPETPPAPDLEGASLEERAAFSLTLNAINFGSGWFPTLRKPSGLSGFRTVEAGLRARGPWTAAELTEIETAEVAATFGQDPAHELMALFTRALRELGERVTVEYSGRFLGLVDAAEGSAERLAETLATWPTWRDVSAYDGAPVPFYKRAQIAAADLAPGGHRPRRGRRPPDAVRRQPGAACPAARRRARVRRVARGPDRRRLPARPRLARGGRDPRVRPDTRSSCSSRPAAMSTRPWSTTSSGTAGRCRATRRGHRARTTPTRPPAPPARPPPPPRPAISARPPTAYTQAGAPTAY